MTKVAAEQTVEKDVTSHHGIDSESIRTTAEIDTNVEDKENEDEDEEEEDEEEAEEIARRLKEQLWADISKAQAAQATSNAHPLGSHMTALRSGHGAPGPKTILSKKQDAALQTMKVILAITANDKLARTTLASAVVPGTNNDNVLNVLNQAVHAGSISKELAKSLTPVLVSLARSDTLFATMRHSNAPAIQLDKGKRKRDESEEEERQNEARSIKRQNVVCSDLQKQITEAVKTVSDVLSASSLADGSLDPSVISSIQLHLHQLFLFSMTSSAGGGPEMSALQEIGGLIQVLGVLSGIQIAPTATPSHAIQQAPSSTPHPSHPWTPQGNHPHPSAPFPGIGTAVYPCLVPGCRRIFAKLFSLRAHQRVHAVHRPFRCIVCPASFARNHDLKRHAKLHEKRAWQCAGCDKMFSRRDAIKRHKNSSAARGGKGEVCVNAAVKEVALDREGDEDAAREGRRTRMWADIAAGSATAATHYGYVGEGHMEEGEVHGDVIKQMQATVLSLHATLQRHVSSALGIDHAAPPLDLDPTGGQATLASVIARAQMQNLAPSHIQGMTPAGDTGDLVLPKGPFSYPGDKQPNLVDSARVVVDETQPGGATPTAQLSLYGLSEEQTRLLEQAIANAASAAQAQAEAEAALEEEDEEDEDEEQHDLDEINGSAVTQAPVSSGQ